MLAGSFGLSNLGCDCGSVSCTSKTASYAHVSRWEQALMSTCSTSPLKGLDEFHEQMPQLVV